MKTSDEENSQGSLIEQFEFAQTLAWFFAVIGVAVFVSNFGPEARDLIEARKQGDEHRKILQAHQDILRQNAQVLQQNQQALARAKGNSNSP